MLISVDKLPTQIGRRNLRKNDKILGERKEDFKWILEKDFLN